MAEELSLLKQAHTTHRDAYHQHIAKNYDEALRLYKISAATGLAKSEYAIGRILAFDQEGKHDYEAALPWILRSSVPRAEHQGYGFYATQQYAEKSLNWFCKNGAAEFPSTHPFAKDPKCLHGRAKALMYGWFNMQKDEDSARTLLETSIAAGWTDAQATLDKLDRRSQARDRKTKTFKIDGKRTLFVLFMLLLALQIFRRLRIRQFIFGVLYRNSV